MGGVWLLGGKVSGGDIALDSKAIAGQLETIEAKFVVCHPSMAVKVSEAVRSLSDPTKVKVFSLGEAAAGWSNATNILRLVKEADGAKAPEPETYTDEQMRKEVFHVFWSSGTTGVPKGIAHSQFSVLNWTGFSAIVGRDNITYASTTTFYHVGGFINAINAIAKRRSYWHAGFEGASISDIVRALEESNCVSIQMGSHQFVNLAESKELEHLDTTNMKNLARIIPVGTTVPKSCAHVLRTKFPGVEIQNVYAQTESGFLAWSSSLEKLGTIPPGVTIKIVDPETGKLCGPQHHGEICCKNEAMTLGYLNADDQNSSLFDSDGFLRTGDIGYFDEKADLFFVDRMKGLMKYMNNHVSPAELDDILQAHPGVAECMVFGLPDPKVQELFSAAVVLKAEHKKVTPDELKSFVNGQVSVDFKKLRGPVILTDTLPRTALGKLKRREMREWAIKNIKY